MGVSYQLVLQHLPLQDERGIFYLMVSQEHEDHLLELCYCFLGKIKESATSSHMYLTSIPKSYSLLRDFMI